MSTVYNASMPNDRTARLVELDARVRAGKDALKERDREVRALFDGGISAETIAEALGVHRTRVYQILRETPGGASCSAG